MTVSSVVDMMSMKGMRAFLGVTKDRAASLL